MIKHQTVLILDYGSQYTKLIARRIREFGIYSVIVPHDLKLSQIERLAPKAIILSGGPSSVYEEDAPQLPDGLIQYAQVCEVPILGICYGMQLIARELGGHVERATVREYGRMPVLPTSASKFFEGFDSFKAWMSHGDEVTRLPAGFLVAAKSEAGGLGAIEHPKHKILGLQFHPEVTHTEQGDRLLKKFLLEWAAVQPDWNVGSIADEQLAKTKHFVGPDKKVICGLSGGVDSAVAAVLVHQAVGDRLQCIFVDHGMLRYKEQERVMKLFKEQLKLPVTCVDASERFLSKLAGVTDPEQKRKIIGAEFIAVFDEHSKGADFLVQGTLYPDVIESASHASSGAGSAGGVGSKSGTVKKVTIKSHHNVGGLPENMRLKLVEPLRELFKDEVRALGRHLGVPKDFLGRHPFPGPGLAVRIIGDITRERIEILQNADEVFISCLREFGLYDKIWQAFAVFLPIKTVGVQGDGRTHDHVVALRAVTSSDGMTADWFPFEHSFLAHVSNRICNEVKGVNRVVYDISSKPPATIEWE